MFFVVNVVLVAFVFLFLMQERLYSLQVQEFYQIVAERQLAVLEENLSNVDENLELLDGIAYLQIAQPPSGTGYALAEVQNLLDELNLIEHDFSANTQEVFVNNEYLIETYARLTVEGDFDDIDGFLRILPTFGITIRRIEISKEFPPMLWLTFTIYEEMR